ncbi:hypothetical protein MD484_g7491, partial [Candolleomyces efflorescens]
MATQEVFILNQGPGSDDMHRNLTILARALGVLDGTKKQIGDTTGNGRPDLIVFVPQGADVYRNVENGNFNIPVRVAPHFGNFSDKVHIRYAAPLRKGVTQVDLIGFHDDGVWVSLNEGGGDFSNGIIHASLGFGGRTDAGGWDSALHLRCLADVNGHGVLDIVGFHNSKVYVAPGVGNGTFGPIQIGLERGFTYDDGWEVTHRRVLADLTGSNGADIIGFKGRSVWVSLNKGNGLFDTPQEAFKEFGAGIASWSGEGSTAFVADVTGNGLGDIVVFGDDGVIIAIGNGDGTFQREELKLKYFGNFLFAGKWLAGEQRVVASLRPGMPADIIGFRYGKVWMSKNDGHGSFSPPVEI